MEILYVKPDPEMDSLAAENMENIVKEYRKKVIGDSCLVTAPSEYWEIGTVIELHWSLSDWRRLSLRERAMMTARTYLNNMVQVIDRSYEESDRAKERNKQDIENNRKNKGKR